MPHITARDGTRLYFEEAGRGSAVVFVHEYAGDWRTWEPQMRYFSRRTAASPTASAAIRRPISRTILAHTARIISRDDVIAVMDALEIDKAHIVGHSMGAATALHVGIHYPERCLSVTAAGCGYGSSADPARSRRRGQLRAKPARCSRRRPWRSPPRAMATAPTRQAHKNKDPRGYAEFIKMLGEHSRAAMPW